VLARSADELVAAHANGQGALILGPQNARLFGTTADIIDEFYNNGARAFALTHIGRNNFSDSSQPTYNNNIGEHESESEHGGRISAATCLTRKSP
jgi:microsomal dipeptidase-like Zn-dependent dipeptidase